MTRTCAVCRTPLGAAVYRSAEAVSVTSLCQVRPERTEVYFCRTCGHLQTPELRDVARYYAEDYRILIASEEEDQLYQLTDGRMVYRMEHQAATLLDAVELALGAAVLDYGCAKAGTLRRLVQLRPDLKPHVFDVSDMYRPFWNRFVPAANQRSHALPEAWRARFALVTAFYSFEHIPDPRAAATAIADVLAPDGTFYGIVPHWTQNVADFLVVDHVQHFSVGSLDRLLRDAGFTDVRIDTTVHASALVWRARKRGVPAPADADLERLAQRVKETAAYWSNYAEEVRHFERAALGPTAVYGSGFYGTFLTTCLRDSTRVGCYVDRNPHRQGQTLLERPVIAPEGLPPDVTDVYVGLNPTIARREIAKVEAWRDRGLRYFFP